jgi:sugar O-acyltransferase (sialic acid O-acetyltransferase NeuD family)
VRKVVVFAVGSPLVVDLEESLARAGAVLRAGIRNVDGPSFLSEGIEIVAAADLTDELRALPFLVPLFTPGNRQIAAREAATLGFTTPETLVDPSVALPRSLELGSGCWVNVGSSLGGASVFGDFVLVNRGASVGHHAKLGRFVSIGPGAVLAGQVTLGKGAVIGAGAVVLPSIRIGENAVVGAGSVVTRDVPDQCLVTGNPARVVRSAIGGFKGMAVE